MANWYVAVTKILKALVASENIAYASGGIVTPAAGAPGAVSILRTDASATIDWWACALNYGNQSAAGLVSPNYLVARTQANTGTAICNPVRIHSEAVGVSYGGQFVFPFPVKVLAGAGAGINNQTVSSVKTLDVSLLFATGVGQ